MGDDVVVRFRRSRLIVTPKRPPCPELVSKALTGTQEKRKGRRVDEITVVATRWPRGWELSVLDSGETITQVATLDRARQQVIDYLDTVDEATDHTGWTVTVVPDDEALGKEIREVRAATRAAANAQEDAARATRDLVRRLHDQGYRGADIAGMLGVTRGRIPHLLKGTKPAD